MSHINYIEKNLGQLHFQFNQMNSSSVYFVNDIRDGMHPRVVLDLDRAQVFKADAVYFRFFDNRPPQAQIYIYDNATGHKSAAYYAEIHRDIWSASEIPMFMIIDKSGIQIYDSRTPIVVKEHSIESNPIKTIDLLVDSDDALCKYQAQGFDCGSFWESDEVKTHFTNNKTAYQKLITGLKGVRTLFRSESGLSPQFADHLLILSILVKYLEENSVDKKGAQLSVSFFQEAVACSSYTEAIRKKQLIPLFEKLAKHFNGGLFQLNSAQTNELQEANLMVLACFLEGTLADQNQLVLWAEYSFKYIPVELISNFYEEFLPKDQKAGVAKEQKLDTGAVYTPSYLVSFLVDECLPLDPISVHETVKLADISCGSGIFLVTAYKRLVQRWRLANRLAGCLPEVTPDVLKTILKNHIFGIDIDKTACALSVFSLNLSLCSMLTPSQIWTELRFDNLKDNGNIVEADFFKYLIGTPVTNFDLIIGNPPFKALNESQYKAYCKLLSDNNNGFSCKIPDHQFALMFLDKAMDLLKPKGLLCLILPSGPLLYNNTLEFRKLFFEKYNIPQIIDFTFLRNTLFEHANVAVAALFAQKQDPDEKDILHLTIKRTKANKDKRYFEIDHYDFHDVPKTIASNVDFVWKTNLVGGGRIYHLIEKFKTQFGTLRQFLDQQQWSYGQGYKIGNRSKEDFLGIIHNKNTVRDVDFKECGITKIEIETETHFETIPSVPIQFIAPHLLIKKTIGKEQIPMEISTDYLTFRNEIIGIHCPLEDFDQLCQLADNLQANMALLRFYIVATSGRFGVQRTPYTIKSEDIMDLPKLENEFSLTFTESILIKDVLEYRIDEFAREKSKLSKQANMGQLYQFSDIYCKVLNAIYKNGDEQYYLTRIYEGAAFFACEYSFITIDHWATYHILSDHDFDALIDQWCGRQALIKRVVRLYVQDKIILLKPKPIRYWLPSIALRDADETLSETFDNNL